MSKRDNGRPPVAGTLPFREYAPIYLSIRNKRSQVVPFVLNEPQLRVDDEIELARAERRPVRLIILKARQLGFSTWGLGRQYERATSRPGSLGLMAAHDDESGVDLFERLRLMHDLAPEKPMTRYSSRRELDFSNPNRKEAKDNPGMLSKILVGTGGKVNLGRSKTLTFLHCSEVAFWANADRSLLSVEQAVPDDPDTIEILESTANGVGGEFHERWKRASDASKRGNWRAIFFAWHSFAEYARPLEGGIMAPIPSCVVDHAVFETEERELVALYGLSPEQLNWRRATIVDKCGNDLDKFHQEYPSTPEEAFLTTGRPVFNQAKLSFRKRALQAIDIRNAVERKKSRVLVGDLIRSNNQAKFVPNPDGPLRIYRLPEGGHEYCIGGDVAEGIVKGKDPDSCAAQVFDRYSWEQVATWHMTAATPTTFAEKLELLGYWYNIALLAPERNNHGHTVVTILQMRKYPKFHVEQDPDSFGDVPIDKPGWWTTKKSRPMLVDALSGAIASGLAILNDLDTIEECLTFVHEKKTGKPQGDAGCHDDLVIASGIALAVMEWSAKPSPKSSVYDPHAKMDQITAAAARDVARYIRIQKIAREEAGL